MEALDLSSLEAMALDETAAKRGHNYVTVFVGSSGFSVGGRA